MRGFGFLNTNETSKPKAAQTGTVNHNQHIFMNQVLTVIFATVFAVSTTHAQDWAKARLDKSPRHSEWIRLKHNDREVNSFIVYPEVKDKATAVVLIHEI